MLKEELVAGDVVVLARSIRALAAEARRTLNRPADESESRELLGKIDDLERQIEARTSRDLSKWLSSLRKKVENHALAEV